MLADVMIMREHSDKLISEINYAHVENTLSNMGHSPMIVEAPWARTRESPGQ